MTGITRYSGVTTRERGFNVGVNLLMSSPRRHRSHDPRFDRVADLHLPGVAAHELADLVRFGDEVRLEAGHVLMREGEWGREAFLLLDGQVEVSKGGESVATLGAGQVVGELAVIEPTKPRNATVLCTTPVTAIVLDPRSFRSLADRPGLDQVLVPTR